MDERVCIFYNPNAGKKDVSERIADLVVELHKNNVSAISKSVIDVDNFEYIVRQAVDKYEIIGIAGGDGSVRHMMKVLSKLDGHKTKLLILPMGTGNDFVKNFEFSNRTPVERVLSALNMNSSTPEKISLYLGECNNEIFATISSIGLDAYITQRSNLRQKKTKFTYIWDAIVGIITYKPKEYLIEYENDGIKSTIRKYFYLLAVANTKYYGGGMKIVPSADPTQSKLAVCFVEKMGRLSLLRQFVKIFNGTHINCSEVQSFFADDITIFEIGTDKILINMDGDVCLNNIVHFSKKEAKNIELI